MPGVIALDAMGSDRAPKPEIEGAIQAARRFGIPVALVGSEETLRAEMSRHPFSRSLPISIIHASEVITMDDKAVQAVRAKRDSSMRVGLRLVREGRAAAFISAGNTGAAMATADASRPAQWIIGIERTVIDRHSMLSCPARHRRRRGLQSICQPYRLRYRGKWRIRSRRWTTF